MNENILWDKKISTDEVKNVLKDENNQQFIYFASTILSRSNNAKKIFSEYIDKVVFCKNWNKIKHRMRQNKWNDKNIDFWDEIYKVVKKAIDPSLLKKTKGALKPIKPKIKKMGDSIRDARKKAKLTQKELAMKTKLSQQTISSLEKGRLNFSFETLIKVLDALNLQIALVPLEHKNDYSTEINDHEKYKVIEYTSSDLYEWRKFS
jgi:transcriptional regulator with XRE-family HTH domain